ncbi:MAG: hypothetical protein QOE73_428 [Verrucomicrobiota bacterium]
MSDVRAFAGSLQILLLFLLLLLSRRAQAQGQDRKMIDRLLRPDMTLQNSAQKKKFVAANAPQDRQVKTKKFSWQEKTNTKIFSNTREFSSPQIRSRSFYQSNDSANLTSKTVPKSDLAFETQTATGIRVAADGDKKVSSRDFAGNHPFLGQGKSQKALSQHDRPLTIEEVRELLNKNK